MSSMVDFSQLCASCKTQGCCTNSAVPLVFDSDLIELKKINKNTDDFLHDRNVNGIFVKAVNKKPNSDICVFWDEQKKCCSIYKHRPFDCRSYPFDILKINGKFHWIVYSCNPQSNWHWIEDYLRMLENDKTFLEVIEKIEVFSGNTTLILPEESKKTPYVVLREVKFSIARIIR